MKKILLVAVILVVSLCATLSADIRIRFSDGPYLGARGFGIGFVSGVINGLSIKNWVSNDNAFQFDIAWDLNYGGIGFGMAYLYHDFGIIQADRNKFPLYIGIKGWAVITNAGNTAAGVQIPLGIAWIPRDIPIDIFVQAEPGLSVVPDVRFAPGGGIGIRFWLN